MKCSVCGTELEQGENVCKNCGAAMTFGNNNSAKVFDTSYKYTGVKTKGKNSGNTVKAIFTVLVIVLFGIGFFMYKNVMTQTVECDSFTAKIPITMQKTKDSFKISSSLKLFEKESGSYGNNKAVFNYLILDLAKISANSKSNISKNYSDLLTEKFVLELFDSTLKSDKSSFEDYKKISINDNFLECNVSDTNGDKHYAKIFCKKNGEKLGIFIIDCLDDDKNDIKQKEDEWFDSIMMK